MTGLNLVDEVNPLQKMKKLKEEAEKRGLPPEIVGDPFLHGIIKNFKKDAQAEIDRFFLNEQFSKFDYMLLTLLLEVKEALSKKKISKK